MFDRAVYVSALQGRSWAVDQHCWDLVRDVQRDLYGRDLPPVLIPDRLIARELVAAFQAHPQERAQWVQVPQPRDGAVVLMQRGGAHARAVHAGVYLDLDGGGVLHVDDPHGVTFDDALTLKMRGWVCEFYVPAA